MRVVLICSVLVACKVDADDGQFLCPTGDCPSGQMCNSAGVCVDDLSDAATDVSLDSPIDAPVDTHDSAIDAAIDAFDANVVLAETCDRDERGFSQDEDRDGTFDEDCLYAFGRPHPLTMAHVLRFIHFSPELSSDGLTLYFAQSAIPGGGVFRATRSAVDEPFGRAERILDEEVDAATVFSEAEYYVQYQGQIRPVIDGTMRTAIDIGVAGLTGVFHPSISRDGLDLFVAADVSGNRNILLSRRRNLAESFETFTAVFSGPERDEFPRISSDRLSLFFTRDNVLHVANRASSTTTLFSAAVPFEGLPVGALQPFHHPPTRELLFVIQGGAAWGPASTSMWRVQVCRDGDCIEDPIPCPTEVRSDDEFHCYSATTTNTTHALADCGLDGFLTSIHSASEIDRVARLRDDAPSSELFWLGGRRALGIDEWDSGEPFTHTEVGGAEPDGCFAVRTDAPRWISTDCDTNLRALCETEVWPTWLTP